MKDTINGIRKFRNYSDWSQFNTTANLSNSISIESGGVEYESPFK